MITRLYTVHIVRKYASNAKKSAPWKLVLAKSVSKFLMKVKKGLCFGVSWGEWAMCFSYMIKGQLFLRQEKTLKDSKWRF